MDEKRVEDELDKIVRASIESGFTHFLSGFASGSDLLFAQAVAKMKKEYPISLEAAIPYSGRMNTPDEIFHRLIEKCDIVKIHSENFSKSCYMLRNKYMVDNSQRVVAIYDGRKTGGTASTVRYARAKGKEIIIIAP